MKVAIPLFVLIVTLNSSNAFKSSERVNYGGNSWYTKVDSSSVSKRDTQYNNGAAPEDPKTVDLHEGEFCVDVSTYGPVQYDENAVNVCDSTFTKNCLDRSEQVIICHPFLIFLVNSFAKFATYKLLS